MVEKNDTLVDNAVCLKEEVESESGQHKYSKTPSASTTKLYQLLATKDNDNIHPVNSNNDMSKD